VNVVCETFIRAVLNQQWRDALLNLNGLNMAEMLRGLAALDRLDLADLWAQRAQFNDIPTQRMQYAYDVVVNRTLPAVVPGDLQATGQVAVATAFIADPTPLLFEHDLTGQLPATPTAAQPHLTEVDYTTNARLLGCEISSIMAVAQVESGGRSGFAADNRPIIRYELHVFDSRTNGTYRDTHPHLSRQTLAQGNRYHTGGQATEWSLMYGAMILRNAARERRVSDAWQSASWGMFQVMGSNFAACGWGSLNQFVTDMFASEGQHLRSFIGYVQARRLGPSIVAHDWATFAAGYNGAGYAINHYDERMATAYAQISARRAAQHLER
jgi:hypothetical protein